MHRTYCATCIQYLESKKLPEAGRYSMCTPCNADTFRECRAGKSDHDTGCPVNTDRQKLLQLSFSQNWKQCSSCGTLVEKNLGCDHITYVRSSPSIDSRLTETTAASVDMTTATPVDIVLTIATPADLATAMST